MLRMRGFEDQFYKLDAAREIVQCSGIDEWAEWTSQNREAHVVDQTNVGMYFVSTIFLGIDLRFFDDGPPILFETIIFSESSEREAGLGEIVIQRRYCTWDQAERGHKVALRYSRLLWRKLNRSIVLSGVPTDTDESSK